MHMKRTLALLAVVALVPLSGCLGVANMDELRAQIEGPEPPAPAPAPKPDAPAPPVARIEASATEVRAGGTVALDGSSSSDPDGRVVAWAWTVDGADAGSSPRLEATFDRAGVHEVQLTVTDDDGLTASASVDVLVRDDLPPRAAVTVTGPGGDSGDRVLAGDELLFSAAGSTDPEGADLTYAWDLGDGATADGETVRHAYATGGRRDVRLTVTDPLGGADEATLEVVVDEAGTAAGTVSLTDSRASAPVPVRDGARGLVVELTYTADLPLEDLDLNLTTPGGEAGAEDDGAEGPLPGDHAVTLRVEDPAAGDWAAHVVLDVGVETEFALAWRVSY